MNSREEGFLLLTSHLGDPHRRPLTGAQLRELARCMMRSPRPQEDRELKQEDLMAVGCAEEIAGRVITLLRDRQLLHVYLEQGAARGCVPLSRVSQAYPLRIRQCLGLDAPGCIWAKGDLRLLNQSAVALVGSRNLSEYNAEFARKVGQLAAQYGLVLISGNARGADQTAQESCLRAGGSVIAVAADSISKARPRENVLFISEDGFNEAFSSQRALSRNRLIHSMAQITFVAQCSNGTGGTWDGTCRNLRGQWSPVYCLPDGSAAVARLYQMGAHLIKTVELHHIFERLTAEFGEFHNDGCKNDKMIK